MNCIQMMATLFSGVGLLIIGLAIPMIRRRVPPNAVYGVRTKASFASEADWYRINAIGGRYLAVTGSAILIVGGIGFALPASAWQSYALGAGGMAWLGIVITCARVCSLKPMAGPK